MNWRIALILFTLIAILVVLFWGPLRREDAALEQPGPDDLQPDFIAEGLFTRIFAGTGELQHEIDSTRMAHYSAIGLTEFTDPVYQTMVTEGTADEPGQWQITARRGSFFEDQRLVLEDNVHIKNLSQQGYIQDMETEHLVIHVHTQLINTDQPVLITGPQFEVRGMGMHIDLNAQQLELTQHVETIFYPQRAARQ